MSSMFKSPRYKDPDYIYLNQREHDLINPHKQQGFRTISRDCYCSVCSRPLKYNTAELCPRCRNALIRGTLFEQYIGSLRIEPIHNHRQYDYLITDNLVKQLDYVMNYRFNTRAYKNKTSKLICIMLLHIEAGGDIEPQLTYRRLRYYADTSRRDSLQKTLQKGKKLFDILFSYLYHRQ